MGFGKDGKGVIIRERDTITLGALNSLAVVKQDNPLVIGDDFRMIKAQILPYLSGATPVENDGPVIIGIADDELSVTEIAECLVAAGPLDRNDNLANERAMRPVFEIAQLPFVDDTSETVQYVLPLEKVVRWTFSNPEGWTLFAFNNGGSALTTGGVISLLNKFYGVWVT